MTGRPRRVSTARAMEDSVITRLDKSTMVRMLPRRSGFLRTVHGASFGSHDRSRGRLGRPTVQFQREAAGASSALIGEFRQGREAGAGHRQSQPRDACGHDRHDALPREPLYEQVSAVGLHQLQRRPRGPHLIVGCCSARKAANKNDRVSNLTRPPRPRVPRCGGLDVVIPRWRALGRAPG
jgi:hypothetical protein